MEANLAKTKLDAYGIPCFLTGENLANLYPLQNAKFSGVNLHLFLKDSEQAHQVLQDILLSSDKELTHCPKCGSTHLEFNYSKKFSSRLISILSSVFFALFPPKKLYHCLDCNHEFKG